MSVVVMNCFHSDLDSVSGPASGKDTFWSTLCHNQEPSTSVKMMVVMVRQNFSCLATWQAVRGLSPVIITTWWEEATSSLITDLLSGFIGQDMITNPTKVRSFVGFVIISCPMKP